MVAVAVEREVVVMAVEVAAESLTCVRATSFSMSWIRATMPELIAPVVLPAARRRGALAAGPSRAQPKTC